MLKVGLTGGIATGKSYVLGVLHELGCEVSDADTLAHQAIEPGKLAYQDIVSEFGPGVLNADGTLNRAALGGLVFTDAAKRERLNAIVHPRVYAAQAAWLAEVAARNPQAIAVLDAALIIETGSYKSFDKVVVVWCEPLLQLERLMTRNHLPHTQAEARIAAQMPSAEKLKYADFAIDTSLGFEDTRRQTETLYAQLKALAETPEP
ncbi:MAG: dephospho-CoA kinase [Acidobacteria bacterium]|nr:dephospho-CoA kinase [Acidobacteriota bacterium]MBI3428419.1 dephospho-CoA kinase [Acidobacteriota bacterium]